MNNPEYDFIVIGSGFGGSVAALRLAEKNYKVLVIEKGKRLKPHDFPETNWNLKKWMWIPALRFFGLFKISFFRHITVLSGVGVGGGSLVYANTLAIPKSEFYASGSWSGLADWQDELKPFYSKALQMLSAVENPRLETGDLALKKLGVQIGRADDFFPTTVAVSMQEKFKNIAGYELTACNFCGGCMTGCRYNAKNTLDKNYLYLAEQLGVKILPETEVVDVIPAGNKNGENGYELITVSSTSIFKHKKRFTSKGVVFAGGVLGTVKLLLKLKDSSLPRLSDRVGYDIRTNSESLVGVTTFDKAKSFSDGVAIGSILYTGNKTHLEPVRYGSGSGFWRILMSPMVTGKSAIERIKNILIDLLKNPIKNLKVFTVWNWAKRTQILLFMQTIDSKIKFTLGKLGMKTEMQEGKAPSAFIPHAKELSEKYAEIVNGKPMVLLTETLGGIPTTAHILGGAVIGKDKNSGVIDSNQKVFGYENLWVCDGSAISANPGVNPSLTILAMTERAMDKVPGKAD